MDTTGVAVILLYLVMTKIIHLIRKVAPRNHYITIDDADFTLVNSLKLRIVIGATGHRRIIQQTTALPLGDILLGRKSGLIVDHIDRDPMNFQRTNLRHLTQGQNAQNRVVNKKHSTNYKGVRMNRPGQFSAQFKSLGVTYATHGHSSPKEAALAYDNLVAKYSTCPEITTTNKSLGLI